MSRFLQLTLAAARLRAAKEMRNTAADWMIRTFASQWKKMIAEILDSSCVGRAEHSTRFHFLRKDGLQTILGARDARVECSRW